MMLVIEPCRDIAPPVDTPATAGDKRAGSGDPATQQPVRGCYPKGNTRYETQGLNAWGGDRFGSRWVHNANADTVHNRYGADAECDNRNSDADSYRDADTNPFANVYPHCYR
jgi:hypothetical protein